MSDMTDKERQREIFKYLVGESPLEPKEIIRLMYGE